MEWIEEQLKEAGVESRRIGDQDLAALPDSDIQTLFMPYDRMALEGEDAVFRFLKRGGNVIAASCIPSVYNPLRPQDPSKQHGRGWYAPFLIRKLDGSWKWARRNAKIPLVISDEAASLVGNLLPATFQSPSAKFTGVDRWNVILGSDGGYGEGTNYALSADVTLDLYKEMVGSGSDFVIHRYYNTQIFGSSFTNVGVIGTRLLNGEKGKDVFKAILHLQEMKFPHEQERSFYEDARNLALLWSDFSWEYIALCAKLRDAALNTYLNKGNYRKAIRNLSSVCGRFGELQKDHKLHLQLLAGKTEPAKTASLMKSLLRDVEKTRKAFAELDKEADKLLADAKAPEKVPVKHKYGTLQLIASLTLPANLNRFRGELFDEMKRMGVTVYSGSDHAWYVLDPAVNAKRKGIARDHKFVYALEGTRVVQMGSFNPADGTVRDGKKVDYPYGLYKSLKEKFDLYEKAGIPQFRIGTGDEMGLGYSYWGTPAQKEFQEALKKYYKGDIAALNAHCHTSFANFDKILLPRRQPVTQSEHALWEHWRRCREAKLESVYITFYDQIKKLKKDLDVFVMPSTGSMESPLYAVNVYNVSKYCDVNAMDGTTTSIAREWIFNDLTRKPLHTSEWGGTYADVNEHRLSGMLWKELSGGMLGAELHVYAWGSDSISFLDILNKKNLRGAAVGQFMKEIRKLDHVLLDGRRAGPEIGILFSQTSRIHDQNWGMNGQKTYSPHITGVCNYYALFLTTQRNARVVPEEKILEEDVPASVKLLILPQTVYLSEELQKKLLDYVKRGGLLLTEGRAGQFDAFGNASDLLFREAGVIPSYTAGRSFSFGKQRIRLPDGEKVFSPSGKGEKLASFDNGQSAVLAVPLGKGKILISGVNSGLAQYKGFPVFTEELLRSQGLTPRLIVSDPSVISREWVHGNDTYLIFAKVLNDAAEIKETLIRIRGNVEVEDYFFGKAVEKKYENGYTSFRTLLTNGGRVFRIRNGAPASLGSTNEAKVEREFSSGNAGNLNEAKAITLPFTGRLFDETPFTWEGFKFTLATIASGDDDTKGETYLTVSFGSESVKKRLLKDKTTFFAVGKAIFKVKSIKNFCKYPFHADLTIEKAEKLPAPGAVKTKQEGRRFSLGNDLVECVFRPDNGAAMTSLILKDRFTDQIVKDSASSSAAFVVSGSVPGLFWGKTFDVKSKKLPAGGMESVFTLKSPVGGRTLTERFRMEKDAAGFSAELTYTRLDDGKGKDSFRWHPELVVGGSMESGDAVFYPGKDGAVKVPLRGAGSGQSLPASGRWTAIADTNDFLACIASFQQDSDRPYIYDAAKFHTLELENKPFSLKKGEKKDYAFSFHFVRGLSGVDAWEDLTALQILLPAGADQKNLASFEVKAGTAFLTMQEVTLEAAILGENGEKLLSFAPQAGELVYEKPFTGRFQGAFGKLPDGACTVRIRASRKNGKTFTAERKIVFAGEKLAHLRKKAELLAEKIEARKDRTSRATYEKRILLESLRRSIALADTAKAAEEIRALEEK